MGFLEEGAPLSWEASARYRDVVKRRGVREFLQLYKQFSTDVFPKSTLSWGDEIEYCLLNLDVENKVARLYLGAEGVLGELKTRENLVANERCSRRCSDSTRSAMLKTNQDPPTAVTAARATAAPIAQAPGSAAPPAAIPHPGTPAAPAVYPEAPSTAGDSKEAAVAADAATAAPRWPWQMSSWHPEYGTHMIEAIPGTVYPLQVNSILDLLPSMQVRRKKVQAVLPPGCYVASVGSFPTMGAPECRPRPFCCCMRFPPSCCCLRAAGREDTSAKEGAAGADDATCDPAAREISHPIQRHGAVTTEYSAVTCCHPAVGVTATSAVSAATDTAADARSPGAANVAAAKVPPAEVAVAAIVSATIQGTDDSSPAAAVSSPAAAYPFSSSAKTDDEEGKADASFFRGASGLLSHVFPNKELLHTVGDIFSQKEVMPPRDLVSGAEARRAVLAAEGEHEGTVDPAMAASQREEQRAEREEQATVAGGEAADVGEQAAKHGHFRHATNPEPTDDERGRRTTAAAAAEEARSSPFLALVGVTAHRGDFASPPAVPDPIKSRSRSLFVGDALINPHPRFGTLTANIRERRGKKVEILIPLFVDENTALPSWDMKFAMNLEQHIPAAAPTICGCASTCHFAADKTGVTNEGVAEGEGGARAGCVAEAAEGEKRARGTGTVATVSGEGSAEGTAEAGAGGPVSADFAGVAPSAAGGSSLEKIASSADETRSREEYYRQLMLEGKILHDGKFIYMDAMGFGMGMHCVQATFGCPSMRDARYLYDQLAVLAPLWLSLSAATPFMRGLLAAVDSRWDAIAACVDCRTDAEKRRLPKSRYGTVSLYISDEAPLTEHLSFYNDVPAPVNDHAFAALVENGVDEILARHMAFLFVRDPLVIFKDKLLAQKPFRVKKGLKSASVRGNLSAVTHPFGGGAATGVPTASATCATTNTATAPTSTSVPGAAVVAVSPTPADAGSPCTATSVLRPPPLTTLALTTACSTGQPRQQKREAADQEEQPRLIHHKEEEEAGEDDTALVAEAGAPWGIDDGTVYTTTQDFENLQSTNWNSVRFKPPAAFKPWTVSATPPSPADACEREEGSVSQKSRESNSRTGMNSRRSNGRKWSCGSNNGSRRRRTYQEVEVVGPGGAARSGGVREEREGCLDRLGVASNGESTRGKSLANTVATQPVGIAESATACLLGGGSGRLATPAAVGSGQAVATGAGKDGPGRPSLGVKKLTTHAEGVEEGAAAESSKKTLPPTPGEDSSLSFSSLFASSPTSVPSSSASLSTAAAATENCCASPWRVEFRTPDVQLTDFENVACLSLVSVLVQVILEERLDLYLPMSLNDENKRRAVECNSILRQKFWFRNNVRRGTTDRSFGEFSLHQILFGVSASRVSDASPLQMQRDSSSSTRLSSASSRCRSPFSLSASNSVIHYSFSGSPFVPSPVSSLTSYAAAHPHTPHCSPVSPSCTPTVTLPPAKPDSTVSSPVRASPARLRPPPLSPQTSPGGLPRCFPPLLHVQDIGVDEYSVSAPTLSAAARTPFDVVPVASLASTCPGSSRSAASAPAPVRVRTPLSCHAGAGGVRVGLDTTLTRAPLSVASSLPGPFPSSSLPPSMSPFVGLVPLCLRYIEKEVVAGQCSCEAAAQYLEYFDFLRHRTEGRVPTDASFLRACLAVHPAYNQDSVISTQACFDLCQLAVKLGHGEFQVPELFGPFAGRAGMRVSADSCEFNNGVPVVTASFLSQFVSDTLKEMLCGYVVEAPEGRWQQEIEQVCAHKRWGGATEGKDGTALGSEKPYIREETRATATAASTETHIVTQEGEAVADPGGQEGTGQGLDQKRATTSGTDCKVLNNGGAEGEAACNTVPRDEGAAIKGSARLRNDIVTIQRSKKDTPAGQQVPLGKKPASDLLLTYQPAGTCSKTTSAVEMVGNTQELSRGSGAGNGESDGGTEGQPLYKEATVCRASSKPLAWRSVSPTNSRDGNIPQEDNGSGDTNKLTGERENSAFDPKKGGEGFSKDAKAHNDNEELDEDLEGKENEDDGSERIFGNQNSSTVSRRNCATTEGKVRYLLQLDGGLPSRLQEKSTVDSVDLLTTAAPAGSARTTGEEDFPWSATRNAAAPTDADTPAQLKVGVKNTPSCKLAAAAACRGPPSIVALSGSSFAREAGHSGARVYFKEEKADRRIVFALSGKAAASLCYADTVSTLRSYMSDPVCRSSGEAGSCAPAASAVAGAGKKRSCNMYSGWPACASVGVTNEEATGLWLFLTSGVHYNWCCDDSGSTSCPSTDDDRESADEVSNVEIYREPLTK